MDGTGLLIVGCLDIVVWDRYGRVQLLAISVLIILLSGLAINGNNGGVVLPSYG